MRAHYLQHIPFEGLGWIEPWLRKAGWDITRSALYAAEPLPDPGEVGFVIAMGGPMSVNEEDRHPWLVEEKRFLGRVIETGKPVLGICLGAQLIASALGARVRQNAEPEIGWWPVDGIRPGGRDDGVLSFPDELEVFQWHGETFDLPAGAVQLARSEACENQAFQIGGTVVGLQFHLESTPETVFELAANCREDLIPRAYVQTEREILAVDEGRFEAIHRQMNAVLEYLAGRK